MQWKIQYRKFTTNKKVKTSFFLTEFSTIKIATFEYHIDESTDSKYDMILGRYTYGFGIILELLQTSHFRR